jgi:hypothetical protein
MPTPRRLTLALILALAAGTAAATTVAVTAKPAASQSAPHAYATRDQLRDCMDTEDALKAKRRALEATQATHEAHVTAFEAENAKIVEVQGQLDHDSPTAISAFNLLVSEHNVHVKALNQEGADDQAAADSYNADALALNRKCASLVYRVEDMDAVMKERRKADK